MKKLIASFKRMPLRQILTVFLAGIALLINTACSQPKAQAYDDARYGDTMKGLPGRVEPEVSKSARYKPEPKSGMNAYSDTDPRTPTKEAENKAETLVKNAEENISEKRADSPEQYVRNYREGTPLGERVRRIGEDVGSSAEDVKKEAQDTVKGAQRSASATTERAQAKASEAASNTRQATRNAADRATSAVKGTTERAQAKTAEAAEDTQEATGNILDKVTKSVKRAAEDASDFVENTTEQAARGTQRAVKDASDAAS